MKNEKKKKKSEHLAEWNFMRSEFSEENNSRRSFLEQIFKFQDGKYVCRYTLYRRVVCVEGSYVDILHRGTTPTARIQGIFF